MSVTRIFDLLKRYRELYPQKPDALAAKVNGEWKKISTSSFLDSVESMSYGFLQMGVQKGDKIATLSNNRPEWNFVDLGMMSVGAIHVPVYPTVSESDLKFILKDAEVKYVFVSGKEILDKVESVLGCTFRTRRLYFR
jgi:long-chain acyl-CoA synthetase